jgi:hypothetical protein
LYLYAAANPINRVDPTGLFSRKQIAESMGFNDFEGVINFYQTTKREHWGYLASLLRALPGDFLISTKMKNMRPSSNAKTSRALLVNYHNGRIDFSHNYSQQDEFFQRDSNIVWWRRTDATHFEVKDSTFYSEVYVDGRELIDLPDFWAGSVSISPLPAFPVGVTGQYIVDRFGQQYYSIGIDVLSVGSPVNLAYTEGYISQYRSYADNGAWAQMNEDELRRKINEEGGCLAIQGSFIRGGSVGRCAHGAFVTTYSTGFQAGVSLPFSGSLTWMVGPKDSSLGWDDQIQQIRNGVMLDQLRRMPEVPYCEGQVILPLNLR